MNFLKKIGQYYFDLCRQTELKDRTYERLHPKFWHKDYFVLHFINHNIRRTMKHRPAGSVLDLGCSHKPYAPIIKAQKYVGVDFFNSDFADIKADLNIEQDFGERYNLVVCFDTMEHVLRTDNLIATMRNSIKPGGRIVVTAPFFYGIHDEPEDYHRFTEYFYRSTFKPDFQLLKLERSNTYFSSLVFSCNSIMYRLPVPYFLKYPLYAVINVFGIIVEYISRQIPVLIPAVWLKNFIWSAPLEYFAVYEAQVK